jgi:hypothetical protein
VFLVLPDVKNAQAQTKDNAKAVLLLMYFFSLTNALLNAQQKDIIIIRVSAILVIQPAIVVSITKLILAQLVIMIQEFFTKEYVI